MYQAAGSRRAACELTRLIGNARGRHAENYVNLPIGGF
jgi:hypothetical protein